MNAATRKQIKALDKLRLPELQQKFAEHVGETTRSPNKKYLIRRISEALQAAESGSSSKTKRPAKPKAPGARSAAKRAGGAKEAAAKALAKAKAKAKQPAKKQRTAAKDTSGETPLSKLSVPKLQERYKEIVGRTTGSKNAAYLVWKIRQAEQGKIPVGPTQRRSSANPGDFKVIPLRMETEIVDQIDAARERLELPSRTTLIRRALMLYLAKAGENDVAALLEQGE
ncbi:ribbon-helix-helix domain-containing protein [Myxococcota bacterium]|nr:ribbon-helix-helix domain-containing protein [Myxococcota bacterium]MBU1413540.1 ribbon-helix-helix domain-containing protein [Myxococcota bacterium]